MHWASNEESAEGEGISIAKDTSGEVRVKTGTSRAGPPAAAETVGSDI